MKEKLSTQEKMILEAALKLMFEGFYDNANIESVSRRTQLNTEKIRQYYGTDENLRMSAMKYAAVVWVKQVRSDLEKVQNKDDKIYAFIRHFIAGTESYSQSLSLYIDIWKKLRDLKSEHRQSLGGELLEIYLYYVRFFQETMKDIFDNKSGYDMEQLAWLMVVISDGFHVQSLIQLQQFDFDKITRTFCRMLEA